MVDHEPAELVVTDPGDQVGGYAEPGEPDRDVEAGAADGVVPRAPVDGDDDVDEGLADDHERAVIAASVPEVHGRVGLQLWSLWSELIERIVPLRERITSEWVLAPPAR